MDPACGTGAFLIASLNKLIKIVEDSDLTDKKSIINDIRTHQLIGIEKSTTMFTLALSNMLLEMANHQFLMQIFLVKKLMIF